MRYSFLLLVIFLSFALFVGIAILQKPLIPPPEIIQQQQESFRKMIVERPHSPIYQNPQKTEEFTPDLKKGGKSLQSASESEANGQLRGQGQITRGTVLHEATHMLNYRLTAQIGGNMYQPSKTYCAFYIWNEDQYLVIPTANFTKSSVIPYIPMGTVYKPFYNNYFGSMFASRDAIHIVEDFDAELNGFEADSPMLLRDMVIYSVALGYKMQVEGNDRTHQYQAGDKFLIERAVTKSIDLSTFRTSNDPKAVVLRTYVKNTYGTTWTRQYLQF